MITQALLIVVFILYVLSICFFLYIGLILLYLVLFAVKCTIDYIDDQLNIK